MYSVTDAVWEKESRGSKLLVLFEAAWCASCKPVAMVINETRLPKGVKKVKVDVFTNPELCSRYRVRSVPRVLYIEDGCIVSQINPSKIEEELKDTFDEKAKET